jgi:hypothetical protein
VTDSPFSRYHVSVLLLWKVCLERATGGMAQLRKQFDSEELSVWRVLECRVSSPVDSLDSTRDSIYLRPGEMMDRELMKNQRDHDEDDGLLTPPPPHSSSINHIMRIKESKAIYTNTLERKSDDERTAYCKLF